VFQEVRCRRPSLPLGWYTGERVCQLSTLPQPANPITPADTDIEFDQVNFGYDDRPVLTDVTAGCPRAPSRAPQTVPTLSPRSPATRPCSSSPQTRHHPPRRRILFLNDGHIVEDGTHDTLVGTGGRYARLWNARAPPPNGTSMPATPNSAGPSADSAAPSDIARGAPGLRVGDDGDAVGVLRETEQCSA
jgi:hypothetical protein